MKQFWRCVLVIASFVSSIALCFTAIFIRWLRTNGSVIDGTTYDIESGLYWIRIKDTTHDDIIADTSLYSFAKRVCNGERIIGSMLTDCGEMWQRRRIGAGTLGLLCIELFILFGWFIQFWVNVTTSILQVILHGLSMSIMFAVLMTFGAGYQKTLYGIPVEWSAGWWCTFCLAAIVFWSSTVMIIYLTTGSWGKRVKHRPFR